MGDTILLRRGKAANLPDLQEGEPGFVTDTGRLYIGTNAGTAEAAILIGPQNTPEWYGAVGDGTTDDAAAMQLYFDADDNPVIPAGKTYLIGTQLTAGRDNFHLTINGTIKWKDSTAGGIIEIRGDALTYINNVSVSGTGTIDGNRDNQTGTSIRHGIGFRYINGVSVSGITVKMVGNLAGGGAYGKGIYVANCTLVRIDGNYFYGNICSIAIAEQSSESPAITLPTDAVQDIQIVNNYIDQLSGSYNSADAISLQVKRASLVSNNIIKNVTTPFLGIWYNAKDMTVPGRAIISNNSLYNIAGAGIGCESDTTTTGGFYFIISGNHLDTIGQSGIIAFGQSVISNNVILDTLATGIALNGSGETTITGNYIHNSVNGIQSFANYGADIIGLVITGNIVINASQYSISVTTGAVTGTTYTGVVVSNNYGDVGNFLVQAYTAGPPTYGVRYAAVIGNVWNGLQAGSVADTVDSCIVQHNVTLP